MSEIDIDFGEVAIRFSRLRTLSFDSGVMIFSCRTGLLSYVAFFNHSDFEILYLVDRFGNPRFPSFWFTYSSRSEHSSTPIPNSVRAVRIERYISVGSRKMIPSLCRLAGRSPILPSKTKKNSPHSFIKTPNGVLIPFASFCVGFPIVRRSHFGSCAVLADCSPPEGLAALDGRCPGKVPERTGKETGGETGKANSSCRS